MLLVFVLVFIFIQISTNVLVMGLWSSLRHPLCQAPPAPYPHTPPPPPRYPKYQSMGPILQLSGHFLNGENMVCSLSCLNPSTHQKYLTNHIYSSPAHLFLFFFLWSCDAGMDREAIFFTGRGGAGRDKAKILRGEPGRGTPPSPQCGAGRGRGQNLWGGEGPGRGTYCVYTVSTDRNHMLQQRKS